MHALVEHLATRSHGLRGNAVFDALRRYACAPRGRRASRTAFPRRAWERVLGLPGCITFLTLNKAVPIAM
jgi:hypothetical protein